MKRLLLIATLLWAAPARAQGIFMPFIPEQFHNSLATGPLSNGFVCTVAAGSTTNWLTTYQNVTLSIASQNPIRLNSAGRPTNGGLDVNVYLNPTLSYKFIVYAAGATNNCNGTAVGNKLYERDNISFPVPASALAGIGEVQLRHSRTGNVWTLYTPEGAALTFPGTTCILQDAITYAHANHYTLRILGGDIDTSPVAHARITCSTPISVPAGQGPDLLVDGMTDFLYTGSTSSDFITFDTMDLTNIDWTAVQIIYPGTGCAIHLKPTSILEASSGYIGMTSSRIHIGTIAVTDSNLAPDDTRGYGVCVTNADHPIIGMDIEVREVNGSLVGFQINSPTGTPNTGFEYNTVRLLQQHHISTAGLKVGTSTTNAARITGNKFHAVVHLDFGAGSAVDVYGKSNSFDLSLQGGTNSTGVTLETSAAHNLFTVSNNNVTTPWVDNSTSKDNIRIDSAGTAQYLGGTATELTVASPIYLAIGNSAAFIAQGAETNGSFASMSITNGSYAAFQSGRTSSGGTYLPMTFFTSASRRATIDADGTFRIGNTSVTYPASVGVGKLIETADLQLIGAAMTSTGADSANTATLQIGATDAGSGGGFISVQKAGSATLGPFNVTVGADTLLQLKPTGTDRTCIYVNGGLRLLQVMGGTIIDGGAC